MTEVAGGMTAELYKAVIAIVDERVKEIRVTRKDFDELKGVIQNLVQAQTKADERMGRLEQAIEKLTQVQAKTEKRMGRLEQVVEKLTQVQAKTEDALTNLAHQVGRMSDTLGYGLEDLGQWVLPAYFERVYGITGVKKCTRKFVKTDKKEVEINLYAEGKCKGETIVLLGESKNRIGRTEVKSFVKRLQMLEPVLDRPTFRFIFGYWAHPSAERLAREKGIEVICSYQLTR